ncbi:MAG: thermonuclease family protein [Desulfatibacillum sp.]|nr:thermonuclease family protein [Desulfatibacillum sp.]
MPQFSTQKKILGLFILGVLAFLVLSALNSPDWIRVKYVLDGDTIILEDGRHIRYIGINAPELMHDNRPAEPFGNKALALNRKLVEGKKIRLETDKSLKDHYGRSLAYVYLKDGAFVNREMIARGMAHCLYHSPNTSHFPDLLAAQQQAMQAGQGVWADWRYKKLTLSGNIRTKRFHLPQCPSLAKIHTKNRVLFPSLWDAFFQGYSPCKRCLDTWWTAPSSPRS